MSFGSTEFCSTCHGRGEVVYSDPSSTAGYGWPSTCPTCWGSGRKPVVITITDVHVSEDPPKVAIADPSDVSSSFPDEHTKKRLAADQRQQAFIQDRSRHRRRGGRR